jgi:hypothetical protein
MLTPPVWWGRVSRRKIVSLFAVGLIAGGLTTASTLWLLSGLASGIPEGWRIGGTSMIAVCAVLRDLQVLTFPLPENARLVPRLVFNKGERRGALQFGFEMGTGVRTFVSATAPYVLAFGILAGSADPVAAFAAGIGFGLGRWMMLLARLWSGGARAWDRRLNSCVGWLAPVMTALCGALVIAGMASS